MGREVGLPIGALASRTGTKVNTIRYYEDIGLLRPARTDNGYRDYSMADVHRLRFLQRSRRAACWEVQASVLCRG